MCAICYAVPFPVCLFLALAVVAFENSDRFLAAIGAAAVTMMVLTLGLVLPGIGPLRQVQRWACGEMIYSATALEATYIWARGAPEIPMLRDTGRCR